MACPGEDTIAAFVEAELPDDEGALLRGHLDVCEHCRRLLAELATDAGGAPLFPERYRVEREIGRGGYAHVFRAFDAVTQREVAIKELLPGPSECAGPDAPDPVPTTAARSARFLREARIAAGLAHPGIAPVYDIGERADGRPFFTMQLVGGRTLAQTIRACGSLAERMRLLPHVLDLCDAVSFAHHRGIVHRDVKPQNAWVGEFGQTLLLDWGLAKVVAERDRGGAPGGAALAGAAAPGDTLLGEAIGTPAYMSPEQAAGRSGEVDERSDVFGLGAVLFEVLTGEPPVYAKSVEEALAAARAGRVRSVREVCPSAPAELAVVAEKALSAARADRYEHAGDLAADLRAYMAGERVGAYEYSSLELVRRLVRRHARASLAAAAALVALVGGLVALTAAWRNADEERRQATIGRAEALREGAQTALHAHDLLEARAKLRTSLESVDSLAARSLWRRLATEPLRWRLDFGVVLYGIDFSPARRLIAVGSVERVIYLIDADTQATTVLRGEDDEVFAVRFSPDGRQLATGTWAGGRLWDLERATSRPLAGACRQMYAVAFSPDGSRLYAACGASGQVSTWERPFTGPAAPIVLDGMSAVYGVAATEGLLAASSASPEVRLVDLRTGAQRSLACHTNRVPSVVFSPDGSRLASAGSDGRVCLWETQALPGGQPRVLVASGAPLTDVVFDPSSRLLATAARDGLLRVWDVESGALHRVLAGRFGGTTSAAPYTLAFSADGSTLASAHRGGDFVALWSTRLGEGPAVSVPLAAGAPGVRQGVSVSPDGSRIAVGGKDGGVRIYARASGTELVRLSGHDGMVNATQFAPDGRTLASAGYDRVVRLWDATSGRETQRLAGHAGVVTCLRFSPNGRWLATAAVDHAVRLWRLADGSFYALPTGDALALDFAPGGDELAVAGRDGAVSLWDPATGALLERRELAPVALRDVSYLPGSRHLVLLAEDGVLTRWDRSSRRPREIGRYESRARRLAVSPDGRSLATAHADGTVLSWRLGASGAQPVGRHRGEANAVVFTPDGRALATAGDDGTLRLWDLETRRPLWRGPLLRSTAPERATHQGFGAVAGGEVPEEPPGPASATPAPPRGGSAAWREAVALEAALAAESPSGEVLCIAGFDGVLALWDVAADRLVAEAAVPGVTRLVATKAGCFVLAGAAARALGREAAAITLAEPARALGAGADALVVATDGELLTFDSAGSPLRRDSISPGVTAIARLSPEEVCLGFADGAVELWRHEAGTLRRALVLGGASHAAAVQIVAGPPHMVLASFADGTIAGWDSTTGRLLERSWLHGATTHLRMDGHRLLALTELGSHGAWDLEVYYQPYCDLLREVWRDVGVGWEAGGAVRRSPDPAHGCQKR